MTLWMSISYELIFIIFNSNNFENIINFQYDLERRTYFAKTLIANGLSLCDYNDIMSRSHYRRYIKRHFI